MFTNKERSNSNLISSKKLKLYAMIVLKCFSQIKIARKNSVRNVVNANEIISYHIKLNRQDK